MTRFSSDDSAIYYEMGRAGERWLVVQKLDRTSRSPVGEPSVL